MTISYLCLLALDIELVHGVVLSTSQESSFTREVFLMSISNIGTSHILMLDTVKTNPDLLPLDISHIGQHALRSKVSKAKNIKYGSNKYRENSYPLAKVSVDRDAV